MNTYILVDGKLQSYNPIDLPSFKVDHKSDTPDQFQWLYLICKHLDMQLLNTFPVYYDGQGCSILQNSDPRRKLGFLAVLNLVYDEDIFIWIPSETDLLNFYALVQPMLMLQSCKRFWDEEDGYWCRGENFRSIKQCLI